MRGRGDSGGHALSVHCYDPQSSPPAANCHCVWLFEMDSAVFINHHFCFFKDDLNFNLEHEPCFELRGNVSVTDLIISFLDPRRKYHVKILAVSQAGDGYQTDQTVSTPGCLCK